MAEPHPNSPNPALDHESRTEEIIAILSVASILSTLVVAMRTYSRAVILRSFGMDDAIIIPAQVHSLRVPKSQEAWQILTLNDTDPYPRFSCSHRPRYGPFPTL